MVNRLPVTPVLLTPEQKLERCDNWLAQYQLCVRLCCQDGDFDKAEEFAAARDALLDYRLMLTNG